MKTLSNLQRFANRINCRALILSGIAVGMFTTTACSHKATSAKLQKSEPALRASAPAGRPELKPAALTEAEPPASRIRAASAEATAPEKRLSKTVGFTSRDFGVSFRYARQYAFFNARNISGDPERKPQSDGGEGQIALARIEIPKGYYPETDFESGYFVMSLNPKLDEKQCLAVAEAGGVPGDGITTETIDGTDFRTSQVRSGGQGHSTLVRRYVSFTNNTCYEFELGLKTSNEDGMAREVDQKRVMERLESIMATVKILPTADTVAPPLADSASMAQPEGK